MFRGSTGKPPSLCKLNFPLLFLDLPNIRRLLDLLGEDVRAYEVEKVREIFLSLRKELTTFDTISIGQGHTFGYVGNLF